MNNRVIKSLFPALVLGVATASLAQNSALNKIPVRAGIIYPASQVTTGGERYVPTPHVFFNLDRNRNFRPALWDFINPRSQTNLSSAMSAQWTSIQTDFGGSGLPSLGSKVAKNSAPYWSVNLDRSTIDDLAEYDLLLLPVSGTLSLGPSEREKLRRFVDQGGILWVSQETVAGKTLDVDVYNSGPVPFSMGFAFGGVALGDFTSPLLTTPNLISESELQMLAVGAQSFRPVVAGDLGTAVDFSQWTTADSANIRPIVGTNPTNQILGLSQLGEGYVVVSTCNLASYINRGYTNSGAVTTNRSYWAATPANDAYANLASRIVVNMIQLRSGFSGRGGGSRRSGSTSVSVSAPPIERFSVGGAPVQDMAIFKGRLVRISGGTLSVYDANPSNDLDNDGNPDDGVADAQQGGADLIWQTNIGAGTSGVACGEATGSPDPDRIFFVNSGGALECYALDQANPASPVALGVAAAPPNGDPNSPRYTPTIHDRLVFVTEKTTVPQANGRVWAVGIDTLTPPASVGGKGYFAVERAYRLVSPSAGATIGYIPIADNSGGTDRVVYVPTLPEALLRRPAGLTSVWLGARGEKPPTIIGLPGGGAGSLILNTRASEQGVPIFEGGGSLGLKITLIDMATGRAFPRSFAQNTIDVNPNINSNGPGVITLTIKPGAVTPSGAPVVFDGVSNVVPPNTNIRLDYTIDWGAPNSGAGPNVGQPENYVRGDVQFSDRSNPTRTIQGNVAMGANGNLFVATGNSALNGGSFYCIAEEGRGTFNVKYRWQLHEAYGGGRPGDQTLQLPLVGGSEPFKYDASIVDYDGVHDLAPILKGILDQPMRGLKFENSPVVRGDTVYVAISARKLFPTPEPYVAAVLAFKANPGPASMTLDLNRSANLQLIQPDLDRTETPTAQVNALSQGQFGQEQTDPTNPASPTRIEIKNFSSSTRGSLANTLACNLPIYVRTGSSADIKVEPEANADDGTYLPGNAASSWNPLKWYVVLNGMYLKSSPVITGNTLYAGGPSYLPDLLDGVFPPVSTQGLMYAMDTAVSPTDLLAPDGTRNAHIPGVPIRSWYRYLTTLTVNAGNISQPPYFKWPQMYGVTSMADVVVRFRQAVLRNVTSINSVVAGDDLVAVGTPATTVGFRRGDFMIADNGRLVRADSTGNALWSTEFTAQGGDEGVETSQVKTRKLTRPWRAYREGASTWVVDSGADRVVRLNAGGIEERAITAMRVDPTHIPSGLSDNAPLKLRIPRDMVTSTSVVSAANNPFTNPQPSEFWRHYLIADQGNFRIIELVDRFSYDPANNRVGGVVNYVDANTGKTEPALGVIFSHSSAELSGKQFAYNSISRLRSTDGTRTLFAFGFGNIEPGLNSFGATTGAAAPLDQRTGNGGVVIYDPQAQTEDLITQMNLPDRSSTLLWNPVSQVWAANASLTAQSRKFVGLSSVTLSYDAAGAIRVMVTDATGVYDMTTTGNVLWALPTSCYKAMRTSGGVPSSANPNGFRPTFARRLENGNVLIVNAYQGEYYNDVSNTPFDGEVLLLDGSLSPGPGARGFSWTSQNFGFDNLTIRFLLPPLNGVRGLQVPVFADQR